eukprot:GHVU01233285.1.p1 GENE.GHVU01233285.1~~GHVU01233285.1.p1  ORF type:complete len:175 (-),score=5.84 GHVU01233285.1:973-1497(-)
MAAITGSGRMEMYAMAIDGWRGRRWVVVEGWVTPSSAPRVPTRLRSEILLHVRHAVVGPLRFEVQGDQHLRDRRHDALQTGMTPSTHSCPSFSFFYSYIQPSAMQRARRVGHKLLLHPFIHEASTLRVGPDNRVHLSVCTYLTIDVRRGVHMGADGVVLMCMCTCGYGCTFLSR